MRKNRHRYTGRKNWTGLIIAVLVVVLGTLVFLNYTYQNQPEFKYAIDQMMSIFRGDDPKMIEKPSKPGDIAPPEEKPVEVPTEPIVPEEPKLIRGAEEGTLVYVPPQMISAQFGIEDTVALAKRKAAAGVLVDIKITGGEIVCLLESENESIKKATIDGAYDLKALATRLENEGLYLAGRISAFKDDLAPRNIRAGFVSVTSGVMFLDGTNKRNLDPYKQPARDYVTEVALEAAKLGVKEIFLGDITFPSVGKLDLVKYDDKGVSKSDTLISFLNELSPKLSEIGVKLTAEIPSRAIYDDAYAQRSGQKFDFAKFPCDIAISALVSTMPKQLTISGTAYSNDLSAEMHGNITNAIFSNSIFAQATLVPIIEAGNPATEETLAAQKAAIDTKRTVLWSADGNYE